MQSTGAFDVLFQARFCDKKEPQFLSRNSKQYSLEMAIAIALKHKNLCPVGI
jgi:hypothetical protein